jgi:hypothetical protein
MFLGTQESYSAGRKAQTVLISELVLGNICNLFQHQYLFPEVAGPDGLFPVLVFKGFFERE